MSVDAYALRGYERALPGAPVTLSRLARRHPRATRRLAMAHAALVRGTHGYLAARWYGAPILVLETIGRRTGRRHAAPLVYLPHGDDLVVVPANAGAERPPAWWLNLQAAGEGLAVLRRERLRIRPVIATGIDRERLWQRFRAVAPLEHYQSCARRALPVVVLARAS